MASKLDEFVDDLQEQVLAEAREQLSEKVLDHWMHPRNPGPMDRPDGHGRITGRCGDTMEVFLRVRDGRIVEARFDTDGCATTIASASMTVTLAEGKTVAEARAIGRKEVLEALGGLPEDHEHCANLAACTLRAALDDHVLAEREPWKRAYRRDR